MIHLDTSFLIRALVTGSAEAAMLDGWVTRGEGVGIDSVAWCEFLCGPVTAEQVSLASLTLGPPVPFLPDDAAFAATLFNAAGRRRGSLPDCMIAAVARRVGARLATCNPEDFRRFEPSGGVVPAP